MVDEVQCINHAEDGLGGLDVPHSYDDLNNLRDDLLVGIAEKTQAGQLSKSDGRTQILEINSKIAGLAYQRHNEAVAASARVDAATEASSNAMIIQGLKMLNPPAAPPQPVFVQPAPLAPPAQPFGRQPDPVRCSSYFGMMTCD